jgi:cold shock CspA family protein/ribosome-associated translation inhibitor RaiA
MELPLQIATRNFELSPADEQVVRDAAAKLESFASRIMSCRVLLELQSRRRRTGDRYHVRIDLVVPGGEIVIKRQSDETLLSAAQEAFKAAGRRLQDQVRKQRGAVKVTHTAPHAVVTRLLPGEGYGFLTTPDGREIYFDRNSVLHQGFDCLEVGAEVRYVAEPGEKGPQASTVALVTRRGSSHS